jgi:hypothetical protein
MWIAVEAEENGVDRRFGREGEAPLPKQNHLIVAKSQLIQV